MFRCASLVTPLGTLTMSADPLGLCGLSFPGETVANASGRQVAISAEPLFCEAEKQIIAYLAGDLQYFDLPLSIHGTPFRRQVWQQLRTIPYGRTRSYSELAADLGDRRKARAVGGAAGANPLALVIPCHRLIGANGSLTGFGGGLALKQILLELEGGSMVQRK